MCRLTRQKIHMKCQIKSIKFDLGSKENIKEWKSRGGIRMISYGVRFDQIAVLTLSIRTERPK